MIGQRYEFSNFEGETWVSKLVELHYQKGGLYARMEDEDRIVTTRLGLDWRPAA